MRPYRQHCPVAKGLELIGDRWNLLIVRELMARGACRYTDLLGGLPGIATNLLADRLRDLEQAGIVYREAAPPPIATTLFRLTERGEQLKPLMRELVRWGLELLPETVDDEAHRSHWLALGADLFLTDHAPERPSATVEVRAGDEPVIIETIEGDVRTRVGSAEHPELVLSGTPKLVLGLILGKLSLADAQAHGLQYDGDPEILHRLQPGNTPEHDVARALP